MHYQIHSHKGIDGAALHVMLRTFLRVIGQSLQALRTGAGQLDTAALHIGAVAFIHCVGSNLNGHVHFQVCVVDGVTGNHWTSRKRVFVAVW